ncbi:DUF1604-domain-containing protein [Xylariaceae sp. FL1019]|nr:DUF1604-domain-containing protein [Xylariaceae sp. FL1019]
MSYKRTRAQFEADLQAQQSPYVLFGTPLPPLDPEVRDDGSYVPAWKQEVRDEQGRKRLHGAFTGGWSAGYFNTVGSKEGWAPSTFVSSRTNRHKAEEKTSQQRIEDFMDDEDLADAAEAEKLQTAGDYAGLGSTEDDGIRRSGLSDLFKAQGETMGVKLLKRMGWKDGQGIGPKVRRTARLETGARPGAAQENGETHLFAPDNVMMIAFTRKTDRKGLGFEGESKLTPLRSLSKREAGESSEDDDTVHAPLRRPGTMKKEKKNKLGKGSIGIGILNDTGSDDEDPFEIGPKISYNRVIGGDKKKKKPTKTIANPSLGIIPVFRSRKNVLARASRLLKKCHDGRLPLDGFVFGTEPDSLTTSINTSGKYAPPQIPPGWVSAKSKSTTSTSAPFQSTADAAKSSVLDPKYRAAVLGEAQLPGKSIFDFLSTEARERLATATGKSNLPQALGEIPAEYALTEAERQRELLNSLPELDKPTAIAALSRTTGPAPYLDDDAKRGRYRAFLEHAAGFTTTLPSKPVGMKTQDWTRELNEFISCARIFKPMTGLMASRFTTASSAKSADVRAVEAEKPKDPAEEAAKLGMYGSMTRRTKDFYPSRLLCKRFNVPPPKFVQPDEQEDDGDRGASNRGNEYSRNMGMGMGAGAGAGLYTEAAVTLDELMRQAQGAAAAEDGGGGKTEGKKRPMGLLEGPVREEVNAVVKPDVNDALEDRRAQDDVLKAIFGDSSDEED